MTDKQLENFVEDMSVMARALTVIARILNEHSHTHKEKLTVMTQATDDQKFTQIFTPADADGIADGSLAGAVTVTFEDAAGNDLSKWIEAIPDPANPLKFDYVRKPSTGDQPAQLDFVAVGTATVGTTPASVKTALSFLPGAPVSLTATTTVESVTGGGSP